MKKPLTLAVATFATLVAAAAPAAAAPSAFAAMNHASYWGEDCYKVELADGTATFELTEDADLLVIKAGRDHEVIEGASAGTYTAANGKDISHVIVCPGDGYPGGGGGSGS